MAERDRAPAPATDDGTLTFEDGVTALEGLFGGSDDENPAGEASQEAKAETEAETEETGEEPEEAATEEEEAGAESPEETDDDAESSEETEEETDEEESEAITLADDTEIDLGDGNRVTLAELKADHGQVQKRVADFQRDYTQKTTALQAERDTVKQQEARVLESAQQLKQQADTIRQQRDMVLRYMQEHLPPDPAQTWSDEDYENDPTGYGQAQRAYQQASARLNAVQQAALAERQEQETAQRQEMEQALAQERQKLHELRPELKNPTKAAELRSQISEIFESKYGISGEEIDGIMDSRFIAAMIDFVDLHKKAQEMPRAVATVRKKVESKPQTLKAGKRSSSQDRDTQRRAAKFDKLRKTGDFETAVDALLEFDL